MEMIKNHQMLTMYIYPYISHGSMFHFDPIHDEAFRLQSTEASLAQ